MLPISKVAVAVPILGCVPVGVNRLTTAERTFESTYGGRESVRATRISTSRLSSWFAGNGSLIEQSGT